MQTQFNVNQADALVSGATLDDENLLAKANLYRFFAESFEEPSALTALDSESCELLLESAATTNDRSVVASMVQAVSTVSGSSVEERLTEWRASFGRPASTELPPYSSRYGTTDLGAGFREMQELADVAGYYRAFGVQLTQEFADRPDHAACELEFLALLCGRELAAIGDESDNAEIAREARRSFLRDHLGPFAFGFSEALSRRGASGVYGPVSEALRAFVTNEFAHLSLDVPTAIQVRNPMPAEAPLDANELPTLESAATHLEV
jgi:TorA maturation chaperone TorD